MTRVFGINPNKTTAGGSCGPELVTLELRSDSVPLLAFQFGMVRLPLPRSLEALASEPGRASLCGQLWLFLPSPHGLLLHGGGAQGPVRGLRRKSTLCLCEEGGVCFLCRLFCTGVWTLAPVLFPRRSALAWFLTQQTWECPLRSAQPEHGRPLALSCGAAALRPGSSFLTAVGDASWVKLAKPHGERSRALGRR